MVGQSMWDIECKQDPIQQRFLTFDGNPQNDRGNNEKGVVELFSEIELLNNNGTQVIENEDKRKQTEVH
jgi:hypothetical protein